MGVMNADNPNLVRAALDAGIVHLDTAHGFWQPHEEMIGGVIKAATRDSSSSAPRCAPTARTAPPASSPPRNETGGLRGEIRAQPETARHTGLRGRLYLHNITTREAALFEPLLAAP